MYSVGFEVQRMKGASSWIHGWVKTTIFTDICLYRYIIIIIELAPLRHPLEDDYHYNFHSHHGDHPYHHLQLCQDLDDFASLAVDVFEDDHRRKLPDKGSLTVVYLNQLRSPKALKSL